MINPNIIIVGDLFPTESNQDYYKKGDINALFGEKICKLFANASLSICNLEGALTDHTERSIKLGPVLTAPTSVISAYKKLGVDICLLANNHVTDAGNVGVIDTINALEKECINYLGAGVNDSSIKKYYFCELGGVKIVIYNVCERIFNKPTQNSGGAWLYDEYIVCREIKELKRKCEYLIVVYHGGIEQFRYPSPENKKRFHRMADSGADMVLSQHTHCIGCEEWYNGSYLLYGQGNFLFRDIRPGQTDEGMIIEIQFVNGKANVYKHLVKSKDKMFVRYDEHQDLSAFFSRSEKLRDNIYVNKLFQEFCKERLNKYLESCKRPSFTERIIRKFFPEFFHNKYIYKSFEKRHLLTILHTLRSEQKREETIAGLEQLMEEMNINIM